MVFQDISNKNKSLETTHRSTYRLALTADRILAFAIDVIIFSPIISLFLAGLIKELKTYLLFDESSAEASYIWFIVVFSIVGISIFFQTVFTYYWQGTPGQKFLNLKVKSLNQNGRFESSPTLSQSFMRSLFWWLQSIFLGVTLLEVIGHPLRRAFHDRASDTLIVSEGAYFDEGPIEFETKFISQWMKMIVFGLMAFSVFYLIEFHEYVITGTATREKISKNGFFCKEIPETVKGEERLDKVFTLAYMNNENVFCALSEAKFSLWNMSAKEKPWAYLILSEFSKDEKAESFRKALCEKYPDSIPCYIQSKLSDEEKLTIDDINDKAMTSTFLSFLKLEKAVHSSQLIPALALIEKLKNEKYMADQLQKIYVKVIWEYSNSNQRKPASLVDEKIIQNFKERFEIK